MTTQESATLELEAAHAQGQVNHWRAVQREIAARFSAETLAMDLDRAAQNKGFHTSGD